MNRIINAYRNFTLFAYVMYFIKLEELRDKAEKLVYSQNIKIKDRF